MSISIYPFVRVPYSSDNRKKSFSIQRGRSARVCVFVSRPAWCVAAS